MLRLGSGSGSSRYRCGEGVGEAVPVFVLERSEGFLFGIGGGAGLRRTCGCGLLFVGMVGPARDDVTGGRARLGRMGRERVEALEALRRRSLMGSRAPSR